MKSVNLEAEPNFRELYRAVEDLSVTQPGSGLRKAILSFIIADCLIYAAWSTSQGWVFLAISIFVGFFYASLLISRCHDSDSDVS